MSPPGFEPGLRASHARVIIPFTTRTVGVMFHASCFTHRFIAPARTRTRNAAFEAPHDHPFQHEGSCFTFSCFTFRRTIPGRIRTSNPELEAPNDRPVSPRGLSSRARAFTPIKNPENPQTGSRGRMSRETIQRFTRFSCRSGCAGCTDRNRSVIARAGARGRRVGGF